MLSAIRRFIRNIGEWFGLIIVGIVVVAAIALILGRGESDVSPEAVQLTIDAASTLANLEVPTIAARLTSTPAEAILTQAAPTLALEGKREIRQFAASARASSEAGSLEWGAIQATGPANTLECGDFLTAWATAERTEVGTLTLLFAELVRPTRVLVYETYNPGFIVRITITDVYGEIHDVYEAEPRPVTVCPRVLEVPADLSDYAANVVTLYLDQSASTGGPNQIDAVELIGTKY